MGGKKTAGACLMLDNMQAMLKTSDSHRTIIFL